MDRQAVGAHDRLNRARKAPSPATDILMIVVRDAGSVLVPEDALHKCRHRQNLGPTARRTKGCPMTPKGREDMVWAVVNHGLTKAAAARRFNTTVGCRMDQALQRGRHSQFARPNEK
jgi:hypothetical protein